MNAEFKVKILEAIEQAMEHCRNAAEATDAWADRDRLLQLHQSLSDLRVHVAAAQEDFPSDTHFAMQVQA